MDTSTLVKAFVLLTAATLLAAGCDNSNKVLAHSPSEQKAIDDYKNMTPQQHIDMIEKGPMPASAKEAMIKQIKDQNHMN